MIYTTGYGFKTPRDLIRLADTLDGALLVDIRFKPFSRRQEWARWNLEKAWGERYVWLPELGNEEVGTGAIRIKNVSCGLQKLAELHDRKPSLLLFCACWNDAGCHRTDVRDYIERDTYLQVREAKWPQFPPGTYWNRDTKTLTRDRLAEMVHFSEQHPERMDAEKWRKLDATKFEYSNVQRLLLKHLARSELALQEIDAWAGWHWLTPATVRDVLKRMERSKNVMLDRAEHIEGGWVYWYTLWKGKQEDDEREDSEGDRERGVRNASDGSKRRAGRGGVVQSLDFRVEDEWSD